jgi:hypothetical protein
VLWWLNRRPMPCEKPNQAKISDRR